MNNEIYSTSMLIIIIIIIIINRHFKDAQLTKKIVTKAPAVTTIQDDKQSTS